MEKTIQERVQTILIDQLGVKPEQVTPEADLVKDLGADELDIIEVAMAVEEAFSLELPDQDLEKIKTVGDMVQYIQKRLA
jgi:acyl carrier protein